MQNQIIAKYYLGDEIANSVTHGIGFSVSIACLTVMVVFSALYNDVWCVVSCSVFGASLVILYLTSTLYHSIQSPKAKYVLNILDHSCIYLLIAGTYTPYLLVTLRGTLGWTYFGLVWSLALLGILFQVFCIHRFKLLSNLSYLLLGWLSLGLFLPLKQSLPFAGLLWLIIGGLCYTIGIVFYIQSKKPYMHMVWHLFVMAGSLSHVVSILFYVVLA